MADAIPGTSRPRVPARRGAASREREVARLRRLLERAHSPRLQMVLIVSLTGAAGFFASVILLDLGVEALWLRYPLAVVVAYLVFLASLWGWLRLRRADIFDASDALEVLAATPARSPDTTPEPIEFGGGSFGGGGASGSFDDAAPLRVAVGPRVAEDAVGAESQVAAGPEGGAAETVAGVFDIEELAVVLVALAAVAGALWAALWLVWGAPVLLAELLFDAALSAGLYRRLRDVRGEHWLRTAVLRTAGPFAAVALLFSLGGGIMQHLVPEARSIGRVFESLRGDR